MLDVKQHTDLVAKTLGGDDGDLIADALVGLEVESQLGVVALDDDLSGPLDGLGTDATHFGGLLAGWMFEEGNQIDAVLEESGGCSRLVLCGSLPYLNPKCHVKYTYLYYVMRACLCLRPQYLSRFSDHRDGIIEPVATVVFPLNNMRLMHWLISHVQNGNESSFTQVLGLIVQFSVKIHSLRASSPCFVAKHLSPA